MIHGLRSIPSASRVMTAECTRRAPVLLWIDLVKLLTQSLEFQTFSAEFESWFRLHGVQQPFPHGFVVIKLGQLQQVHARTRCRKSVLVPCTVHAKWRVEFLQKRDKLSKPGFTKVSPCAVLRCFMLRCAVLCYVAPCCVVVCSLV